MSELDRQSDLPGLLNQLNSIVKEAGELALAHRERSLEVWQKHRGEPVSEADIAVDKFLLNRLAELIPNCALVSEEGPTQESSLRGTIWIIDPIDGTRAFLKGRNDFAVSVGLIEKGRPILASLFAPALGRHYSAILGSGSFQDGERLHVSMRKQLSGARMVASRHLFREGGKTRGPWPKMTYIRINSFALRIAEVAAGAADAVLTLKAKADWDMAAADLILREAGGEIMSNNLVPPRYGTGHRHVPVVAANPVLLQEISDRL